MENMIIYHSGGFSFARFKELAKADFMLNKGSYLKLAFAIICCYVALAVLISANAITNMSSFYVEDKDILQGILDARKIMYNSLYLTFALGLSALCLTIFGSLAFSNMSSKKMRITALMIPASMSEKFWLRMLLYCVGGTLTLLIGFMIGASIIFISYGGFPMMMNRVEDFLRIDHIGYLIACAVLMAYFGFSLYALGSSLWPKLSWLKTWIAIAIFNWAFGIMLVSGLFSFISFTHIFDVINNDLTFCWIFISILLLLNAICWIGAWYRFRNTQIIQRFMKK